MTKNQSRSLMAVGTVAILVGVVVLVLARTSVLFAPPGEGGLPQTAREKTSRLTALAEAEYIGISKLSVGMMEDAFKRLRPKAKLDLGIDEMQGRNQTSPRTEYAYEEKAYVQSAGEGLPHRMWNQYFFSEDKLSHVIMQWYLPGKDAIPIATMMVELTRKRYGKEDEQIIRDWRQTKPGSAPNLCPELVWRRSGNAITISAQTMPGTDFFITFQIYDSVSDKVASDSIHPLVPVSDAEKRQVFEKFGIPPL